MRVPLLLTLAIVVAGCVTQPPAGPPGPGGDGPGAGGANAIALAWSAPHDFATWGYEPSIVVDQLGTLAITAHKVLDRPETWPYLGSVFFVSRDGGVTWEQPAPPAQGLLPTNQVFVGAEGDLAVDARGWLYYLDTYLGDNHLHVWSDQARVWERSDETKTAGADDRPWLSAQGEGVLHYLGNNGVPINGGRHWYYRSTDAGMTFTTGLPIPGNGWAHLDAERDGQNVYIVQEFDGANAPGSIRALTSTDGGVTFGEPVVLHDRPGSGREYPVVSASDEDGLAWVVSNDCGTAENCADDGAQEPNQLFLSRTSDAGASWQTFNLTLPEGTFADYPWVAAGPNGTVAVAYYGAQAPVTQDSEWFLYAAMARPGRTATPELRFEKAAPEVLYTGADLHALHDFFEIAIGPDEVLHVAYMTAVDTSDPVHDYGERFIYYVNGRAAGQSPV